MIKLLRKLATVMLPAFLCGTLLIGCEADDKYTKVDDLFQPRFVLEKPEVKANSVTLVWYKSERCYLLYGTTTSGSILHQLVYGDRNY